MLKRLFGIDTDSETIIWARLQLIGGALLAAINEAGVAPLLDSFGLGRWVPVGILLNGLVTEYLRRRRAGDLR